MFLFSRSKEAGFQVNGDCLSQPGQQVSIQLLHEDFRKFTAGESYIHLQNTIGTADEKNKGYTYHRIDLAFVPPQTISVTTFEAICEKCRKLNGQTFVADQVNNPRFQGKLRWQ